MPEFSGAATVKADVPAQRVEVVPHAPPMAPTTTHQEDLIVAGQRRINQIWEITQALVTVLITVAAVYCAIKGIDADVLNFAFVAVISTYYARTNHTKIGGVGSGYVGR